MRTVIITGASDGIGAAAAKQVALDGSRLILVGRSAEKTRAVASDLGADYLVADFTRLDDVRELAAQLLARTDRIDVLANNAGGIYSGPTMTPDGFEETFHINHLAPFLLTHLLIDRLTESGAQVVNTSSVASRIFSKFTLDDVQTLRSFSANRAYGNAKLANILFTAQLHARYAPAGLAAVAFHPGNVATNFASETSSVLRRVYQTWLKRVLISPAQGGANLAYFIQGIPGVDWQSGAYYDDKRRIGKTNPVAADPRVAEGLWAESASMLGLSASDA